MNKSFYLGIRRKKDFLKFLVDFEDFPISLIGCLWNADFKTFCMLGRMISLTKARGVRRVFFGFHLLMI
jgi:hypothetical protein